MLINKLLEEVTSKHANMVTWPEKFINSETGKEFVPQNDEVYRHIFKKDTPPYLYFMSGEGAGKTATLSVLVLNKLKRGLDGCLICIDLPMLQKVWQEFRCWIDPSTLIPQHRHMLSKAWTPYKSLFELVFYNELGDMSKLIIGGLGDNVGKWESLNVNFFAGDEFRHIPSDAIMKIATGRIRVDGPNGEPPQLIIGSTPTDKSHWMYDYFGPIQGDDDPLLEFKKKSKIITLSVNENMAAGNLSANYTDRGLTLNEKEKEIYIEGKWGNLSDDTRFLESMELWDRLYDPTLTPPRKKDDPNKDWSDSLVIGIDGSTHSDSTGIVAVSRSPKNRNDIAVRLVREFKPVGGKVDFVQVEQTIREWCKEYNIITVVFDPYQLYDMTERLRKEGIAWFQQFNQQSKRDLSDNFIYDIIMSGRISHDGNTNLRSHIANAGFAYDAKNVRRRIVKIRSTRKIDLLIALSMCSWEIDRLNL